MLNLSPELVGEFLLLLIGGNVVQLQQGIDFQETELAGEVAPFLSVLNDLGGCLLGLILVVQRFKVL